MILSFDNFKRARQVVDTLLDPECPQDPREHLLQVLNEGNITDRAEQREFLQQFSSLLLNVILNRRQEVGPDAIERVKQYRSVVASWDYDNEVATQ